MKSLTDGTSEFQHQQSVSEHDIEERFRLNSVLVNLSFCLILLRVLFNVHESAPETVQGEARLSSLERLDGV